MKTRKLAIVAAPVTETPRPPMSKFAKLRAISDGLVRTGTRDVEEFKDKLTKDAAYAFSWSSGAFQAAADVQVGREIALYLADDTGAADGVGDVSEDERAAYVLKAALDKALAEARSPSHSTSVQSNEMARCIASVWAHVYQRVEQGAF